MGKLVARVETSFGFSFRFRVTSKFQMKWKWKWIFICCVHTYTPARTHTQTQRERPKQPNSLKIRHSFTNNLHIKRLIMNSSWNLIPHTTTVERIFFMFSWWFVFIHIFFFTLHRLTVASTHVCCWASPFAFLVSHRHSCCLFFFLFCRTHCHTFTFIFIIWKRGEKIISICLLSVSLSLRLLLLLIFIFIKNLAA